MSYKYQSKCAVACTATTLARILHLPLKREYFEQIKVGVKLEEYRLVNDYWRARLYAKDYDVIVLTLGYPKRADSARRLELPYKGYMVKQITHSHFGPTPVFVFAINVQHEVQNG